MNRSSRGGFGTVITVLTWSFMTSAHALGAQSSDVAKVEGQPPTPPQSDEALRAQGWERLDSLSLALEENPENSAIRLDRLRVLYFLSVAEESLVDTAMVEIRRLVDANAGAGSSPYLVVADAYAGALEVVRGRHAFWPRGKWNHVQDGLSILDRIVTAHPESVEARYLRLASCFYLPFFFSRGESIDEDLEHLRILLPTDRGLMTEYTYRSVLEFVVEASEEKGAAAAELVGIQDVLERTRRKTTLE